ncbi:MAG: hypothetical protein ABH914_03500, partial [Candidatus Omnitrophota bacterium]
MFVQKGLFSAFHSNIKKKNLPGQVAVIITFVIALIFLFVMVIVNIGRISDIKTQTANLSDKAALSLASELGSYINNLEDITGCSLNWEWLAGWIAVLSVYFLGHRLNFFTVPVGFYIMGIGTSLIINEIATIMKEGLTKSFPRSMTIYNGVREGVVASMLSSLGSADRESVDRILSTNTFSDPITGVTYDLSASPILNEIQGKAKIPRFVVMFRITHLYFLRVVLRTTNIMPTATFIIPIGMSPAST